MFCVSSVFVCRRQGSDGDVTARAPPPPPASSSNIVILLVLVVFPLVAVVISVFYFVTRAKQLNDYKRECCGRKWLSAELALVFNLSRQASCLLCSAFCDAQIESVCAFLFRFVSASQ